MPVSWEASPLCVCFSTNGSLSLKAEQGPRSGTFVEEKLHKHLGLEEGKTLWTSEGYQSAL